MPISKSKHTLTSRLPQCHKSLLLSVHILPPAPWLPSPTASHSPYIPAISTMFFLVCSHTILNIPNLVYYASLPLSF